MYYIVGITGAGHEISCDFGFDMIERIVLDDLFMEIPVRIMDELVIEKRFSFFGDKPDCPIEQMLGCKAYSLQLKYNYEISREVCLATVIERVSLLTALKRVFIKIINRPGWRCVKGMQQPDLFNHVVIYSPQLLRSLLGKKKYGVWNHAEDRGRALRVLEKLIYFLQEQEQLTHIVLYNELVCPHWEASGEMSFNAKGELVVFNYFGRGNGQAYKYYPEKYYPEMEVWHRN